MLRAVLDVGQYVSATVRGNGHPTQILARWSEGEFELHVSIPILNDLQRVLGYPHLRKRHQWNDDEIDLLVVSLARAAQLTKGELEVNAVKDDPTDNKILACAKEGQVNYIVSSDEHLTTMENFEGIPIVKPRRFLEILNQQKS